MQERDYHHKKVLITNKELHWSKYKWIGKTINTRMRKEKGDYYSNQLADEQDPRAMWQTLHKNRSKKKKQISALKQDGLTASLHRLLVLCAASLSVFLHQRF